MKGFKHIQSTITSSFSLSWSEINYYENQLKLIRTEIPYDGYENSEIMNKYFNFLNSSKSPYNEIYLPSGSKKHRKENGDESYIKWLIESRDFLLDLLAPIADFKLLRKQVREEKLIEILDN